MLLAERRLVLRFAVLVVTDRQLDDNQIMVLNENHTRTASALQSQAAFLNLLVRVCCKAHRATKSCSKRSHFVRDPLQPASHAGLLIKLAGSILVYSLRTSHLVSVDKQTLPSVGGVLKGTDEPG